MTRKARHVEREVLFDEVFCDICGTGTTLGIDVDGRTYHDPRADHGPPAHPFVEGKHCCYQCMKAGKHLGGRSPKPAGMLIAKVYNVMECSDCQGNRILASPHCDRCNGHGRLFLDDSREDREQNGLRLPERPYTDEEWERVVCCGLMLHPRSREAALLFTMRDYWWCPAYVFDGSEIASTLAHKDSVVLFVEPSPRTPFRTVYEAALANDLDAAAVFAHYGAEAADRIREHDALELALRVPSEILQ